MLPLGLFFRAKAIRQLYEYAGFGSPLSLWAPEGFFLWALREFGVRGPGLGTCCMGLLTGGNTFKVLPIATPVLWAGWYW